MSSWFDYLLLGIMAAYLAAGVPILRVLERRRWGVDCLKLWEACVAWLLANAGALAFLIAIHALFPLLRVAGSGRLADILVFGLGLFLTLLILARFWFHRRFGRWRAVQAAAVATVYFFIAAMTVFALNEDQQRRERFRGAVSAKSPTDVKQRTLQELSKGLGLDFPDDTRLVWAHSDRESLDVPWAATLVVELSAGNLPAFMDQISKKGSRRLQNCPAHLADSEELYRMFGPWWGPKKWWHPQSAERFEIWTGEHYEVFIDLDDGRTARLYIIYSEI